MWGAVPSFAHPGPRLARRWLLYAGDTAEVRFSGTRLGFLTMVGPDAGIVTCEVDGGAHRCRLDLLAGRAYFWRLAVGLLLDDLPPGAFTLLLASRMQGNVPNAGGGQGTLCLSGEVGRFLEPGQVQSAALDGSASLQLHLPQIPQPTGFVAAMTGESWNFQAWYRDANPGPTSNLKDGIEITLL